MKRRVPNAEDTLMPLLPYDLEKDNIVVHELSEKPDTPVRVMLRDSFSMPP